MISSILVVLLSQAPVYVQNPKRPTQTMYVTIGDGGTALQVTCDNCSAAASGGGLTDAQLRASPVPVSNSNLDVAISTRTKPADQQHVIIDSSASITATGPLTDTQLRNSAVPVSVSNLDVALSTRTKPSDQQHVVVDLSPDGGTTFDVTGSSVKISSAPGPNPFPLNPFLPRCNPVRRIGCQP